MQNEDGVRIVVGTESHLFPLLWMKDSNVRRTSSLKFPLQRLKVPNNITEQLFAQFLISV